MSLEPFYREGDRILLYHGDALEVLSTIPDNSIDICVTSPPYNVGVKYNSWHDKLDWDDYYDWCRKWLKEIYRVLKIGGRFCLNHYLSLGNSERREAPLMNLNFIACYEVGFRHHAVAIWEEGTLAKPTAWCSWMSVFSPYINCPYEGCLFYLKGSGR